MNSDYPNDNVAKLTAQEYTLTGDPAVILNSWEKPEYVIESSDTYSDLTLVPTNVTSTLTPFAVRLTIANEGVPYPIRLTSVLCEHCPTAQLKPTITAYQAPFMPIPCCSTFQQATPLWQLNEKPIANNRRCR
ncbi:MAG: hypothetical protein IPN94_12155 [Sphingobacteriales bacterium]|nr:hypothetical protein [Sphingobacteriales bacterium]